MCKEGRLNLGGWQNSVMGLVFNVEENCCLPAQTNAHLEQLEGKIANPAIATAKLCLLAVTVKDFLKILISLILGCKHFYFAWT